MDRKVLLVDTDVDALSTLAHALRARGLKVSIASGVAMACERARQTRFDALVAWNALAEGSPEGLGLLDALAVETGRVPPTVLLVASTADIQRGDQLPRADAAAIHARIEQIAETAPREGPPSSAASTPASALTGLFSRTPLRELLLALAAERRTGTLTVTTAHGAGELRLHDGDLVDAVYLRLEGAKAVARLLGEREGSFSFMPRTPPVMRRINVPVGELLDACEREIDKANAARASLGDLENKALFASDAMGGGGPPSGDFSELARAVLARLRAPATIDDVLEELPAPDAEVLEAIRELDGAGRITRLAHDAERVPLVGAEGLHAMRALAARAKAPGYEGNARVLFAGTPGRLAVVAHAALSLADAVAAPEGQPTVPVPYLMASVRLGDDVSVDLVALPLVPAYGPLWPMALAGSAVVVRLDDAAAQALTEVCAAVEVPLLDAASLVASFDEANPALVASAVRAALEGAAG